jgi:hypothetical protein
MNQVHGWKVKSCVHSYLVVQRTQQRQITDQCVYNKSVTLYSEAPLNRAVDNFTYRVPTATDWFSQQYSYDSVLCLLGPVGFYHNLHC